MTSTEQRSYELVSGGGRTVMAVPSLERAREVREDRLGRGVRLSIEEVVTTRRRIDE